MPFLLSGFDISRYTALEGKVHSVFTLKIQTASMSNSADPDQTVSKENIVQRAF